MSKWEAISMAIIISVIFGGLAISDYAEAKASVEKAKAGLEECPVKGTYKIIWVKDCIAYREAKEKDAK